MRFGDPLGYFLTWVTFGTWLPGDDRGWVEYHGGWQLPDPVKVLEAKARMTEEACILTDEQRIIVAQQIAETCHFRGWTLLELNCRTNHIHVVLNATILKPDKLRIDLKAWSTRALKRKSDPTRSNWWAERGSIRYVNTDDEMARVREYVRDEQDGSRFA
jgi:REP element-mobilizing transposase RayT